MKKFIWVLILILAGNKLIAQNDSIFNESQRKFDAYKKAAERRFDAYKKSTERDFKAYKDTRDSIFQQFLKKRWRHFDVFFNKQPVRPKPHQQPVITEKGDTISRQIDFKFSLHQDKIEKRGKLYTKLGDAKLKPIKASSKYFNRTFNYFGIPVEVIYPTDKLPQLGFLSRKSVNKFIQDLAVNDSIWKLNLYLFVKAKKAYKLNDWGLYLILKKASESIFLGKNEQTLFIWYELFMSGYEVKIGYDSQHVYLMLPSIYQLFDRLYLEENGKRYYLFEDEDKKLGSISTFEGNLFKKGRNFSFELDNLPLFTNGERETRILSYNNQEISFEFNTTLIDFFNTYPTCDYDVYFKTPISLKNINSLNKILTPLLEGKKDIDKVNILLNFIQKSIAYQTDEQQFGKERSFFAEETLYYPFADCEDRSALLAMLVKNYTSLRTIGVVFPEHVVLGVHFLNEEHGTYVLFDGKKYFICDPTYINAKSGMLPAELMDEKIEIIKL